MNNIKKTILLIAFVFIVTSLQAQRAQFPAVKKFGGIYEIPFATVNPQPDLEYRIVIDVKGGSTDPGDINPSLNNIARLMNLHVLGGAKLENMKVVAVIHALATNSIITDRAYEKKFDRKNPNTDLIKELQDAGVKIMICGQSMLARDVDERDLAKGVEVSISMLTVMTTYQLQGYAALQF